MAGDYQHFSCVCRLTRDPEVRTFQNGGKVANFGIAFTGQRKKNQQTGEWDDEPCFMDCKAFNRENGRKMADLVERFLVKGKQVHLAGHFVLEKWVDQQTGGNRQALRLVIDEMTLVGPKDATGGSAGGSAYQSPTSTYGNSPGNCNEDDIPF